MNYIVIILSLIILILGYGVYNLIKKNESLESDLQFYDEYIDDVYDSLKKAYDRMVKIDRLGSFESDDESGYIFNEIKSAINELNELYELDGPEEKK